MSRNQSKIFRITSSHIRMMEWWTAVSLWGVHAELFYALFKKKNRINCVVSAPLHRMLAMLYSYQWVLMQQGGMKRWGFSGMPASHGASLSHRSIGSTGQRDAPGRVCMSCWFIFFLLMFSSFTSLPDFGAARSSFYVCPFIFLVIFKKFLAIDSVMFLTRSLSLSNSGVI